MESFDFFSRSGNIFQPKTPVAALKAYETGFNPLEMFIYKSGSAKPLHEEPYDREALEWFLSREDLSLDANALLVGIFDRMIYSEDQELALFAAESINIIENRYNSKIEEIKKTTKNGKLPVASILTLGRLFYELATLNQNREAIKKFYFRESYRFFSKARGIQALDFKDLETVIRILLELELYDNALSLFKKESQSVDAKRLYLKAEIAFRMGNYTEVSSICKQLAEDSTGLSDKQRAQISYWMGTE